MGVQGGFSCLLAAASIALLGAAAPALAAEPTRGEYVDRAEAICKVAATKSSPLLHRGFAEFKANEVESAGPKFVSTAAAYDSARSKLATIPEPAADADDLTEWLNALEVQSFFLRKTGAALADGRRVQAQGLLSRFVHSGNLANDIVLGYGFKYCLFDKSFK
jgi:hypothetical protein